MTLAPCLVCGEPCAGPRCPAHTLTPVTARDPGHVHTNPAAWKSLSRKLRRQSPFCEWCGATDRLSVDHVLPVADYPELALAAENCRVLCRVCNGRRGNTVTTAEAHAVLAALDARQKRRPSKAGRARLEVAQRAVQAAQTRGVTPDDQLFRPRGRQSSSYTPGTV